MTDKEEDEHHQVPERKEISTAGAQLGRQLALTGFDTGDMALISAAAMLLGAADARGQATDPPVGGA